jgi:hypothetical protein
VLEYFLLLLYCPSILRQKGMVVSKNLLDTKSYAYKNIMIDAAMLKVTLNVEERFKHRFKIKSRCERMSTDQDPVFQVNKEQILIGKYISRVKTTYKKEVLLIASCLPEDLEEKICDVLKRQKHQYWYLNVFYSDKGIAQKYVNNEMHGLGALLTKYYPF